MKSDMDLERGDDRMYRLAVREPQTGENETPESIDLTGSTIVFEMKHTVIDRRMKPTDPVAVRKTSDDANEIEILDQALDTRGQCLIKIRGQDTEFLRPGVYAFAVRVVTAGGRRYTVSKGRIFLKGAATATENFTP